MYFDIEAHKKKLNNPGQRFDAENHLEKLIKTAPIRDAIELKKYRTPQKVLLLEIESLRKSGFDMDKKSPHSGEYMVLLLAYHAAWEHSKLYWSQFASRYDMSQYPINSGSLV